MKQRLSIECGIHLDQKLHRQLLEVLETFIYKQEARYFT